MDPCSGAACCDVPHEEKDDITTRNEPHATKEQPRATEAASSCADGQDDAPRSLSKNQQRKEIRRCNIARKKAERKQERQEAYAKRKRQEEDDWQALTEEQRSAKLAATEQRRTERAAIKQQALQQWQVAYDRAPRVVVDMDFDSKMKDGEIKSLAQQIMYCWSIIKQTEQPIQLSVCGLVPGTRVHRSLMGKKGIEQWQMPIKTTAFHMECPDPANIVYLTADSDNVINTLDLDKVYVIGGIVDHNRHKGLTLDVARRHNCSHGKLPLADFLNLKENHGRFTRVLTVNHMVGVLTKYHETKDWAAAFIHAIPSRKHIVASHGKSDEADALDDEDGMLHGDGEGTIDGGNDADNHSDTDGKACEFSGAQKVIDDIVGREE
mmetsp:Transcript_109173/g.189161  ORF Transcript_109173/g.189161 Transcript_109173/m.189161 type:complete len:380 (-) Transcript_109173:1217-2356(-)